MGFSAPLQLAIQVWTRRRGGSTSRYSPSTLKDRPSAPTPSLCHLPPGRRSAFHSVTRYTPCCPHDKGICLGSVIAWNTRSGGAAMKTSATTASLSGVIALVAMDGLLVILLAIFSKQFEQSRPATRVVLAGNRLVGEAAVSDFDPCAGLGHREFPARRGRPLGMIVPVA